MSPLAFFLLALLAFTYPKELVETTNNDNYDCNIRYRRNWYSLTQSEQLLYIQGFQSLRQTGKLDDISHAYLRSTSINKWQDSSLFFPLHEHMTYQLENAIRSLGDEFECFSMPYWDFTIDSGLETDAPIFKTPIGGNGNTNNNNCIDSDYWNICNENTNELCYWTPFKMNCDMSEMAALTADTCCLKRSISTTQILPSSIEIAFEIANNINYKQFTNKIKQFSDYVHTYIGSIDTAPMSNLISSEDPIFFLLSSYIGYIRALWTDCNDYDLILNNDLDKNINAYNAFKTQIKNAKFRSNPNTLNELNMDLNEIFYNHNNDMTQSEYEYLSVKDLYYISGVGVKYNLGTFWDISKINIWCNGHINSDWFVNKNNINTQEDILVNNNYINQYINKMWNDINLNDNNNKLAAVASLSCDYVRKNSLNSCYKIMIEMELNNDEICNDMTRKQLADLTINDLNGFINNNECLIKIRNERWSYCKNNVLLKQTLCNGMFDYKCNKWVAESASVKSNNVWKNEYDGYDDLSPILEHESSESNDDIEHIMPNKSDKSFFIFNTSLWSVIVWCSMFIFVFMICCYMFTVKKDFETESIYKKNRQTAYVAIYGSTNAI